MTILGPLANESPEPLSDLELMRLESKLRTEWSGIVTLEKREMEALVAEVKWLRERLRRVEHAIEPLARAVAGAT